MINSIPKSTVRIYNFSNYTNIFERVKKAVTITGNGFCFIGLIPPALRASPLKGGQGFVQVTLQTTVASESV
jgi:hypothetical protein